MSGLITHKWNGTILTITSDSGTSSMDLKGEPGDLGPRGPQGPAGVIINPDGQVSLEGFATEEYVSKKIIEAQLGGEGSDIDLSIFYTKSEIDDIIDNLESQDIDLSAYYTKSEVDNIIDNLELGEPTDLSNYYTKAEVNALIPSTAGFITMADVEAKGYQTASQVQTAINNALAALDGDGVRY